MTTRLPQIGKLTIPGKSQASLEELVTKIDIEYGTDQVSQLTLTIDDPQHRLANSPLAAMGSLVSFDGESWQVSAIEGVAHSWGTELQIRARDPLARKLRKTFKTSAEQKVSPGDWIKSRVKTAGGAATVQPSSKRATIAQSKNQSVLDVVNSFAAELDWSWTSYGGRLCFASRHYAWEQKLGFAQWKFTWGTDETTDMLTAEWAESDDNSTNVGELSISLPYDMGRKVRPWQTFWTNLPGARGMWLVESVRITHDGTTPVEITATQPTKPSPKPGSGSKE